jgi:hypothetical protein
VWWYTSAIPALGRLRQEDHEFKASLGFTVRSFLKTKPEFSYFPFMTRI